MEPMTTDDPRIREDLQIRAERVTMSPLPAGRWRRLLERAFRALDPWRGVISHLVPEDRTCRCCIQLDGAPQGVSVAGFLQLPVSSVRGDAAGPGRILDLVVLRCPGCGVVELVDLAVVEDEDGAAGVGG